GDPDLDLVEGFRLGELVGEFGQFVHVLCPSGGSISGAKCGGAVFGRQRPEAHSAASGHSSSSPSLSEESSTLRPSERISFTSTLKLSGIPASKVSSPLTIAS